MDSLEEIRAKKMQAMLSEQYQTHIQKQRHAQEQIAKLEEGVKLFLSKEALARYGNIKAAHADLAVRILGVIGTLIQQGKITNQIDDATFKQIVGQIIPKEHETKIRRI